MTRREDTLRKLAVMPRRDSTQQRQARVVSVRAVRSGGRATPFAVTPPFRCGLRPAMEAHPILRGVDAETAGLLVHAATHAALKRRALVAREGEACEQVVVVCSGSVRLFSEGETGHQVAVTVLRAPAVLGVTECMLGVPYAASVEALEAVRIITLPREVALKALGRSTVLVRNLMGDLARQLYLMWQRPRGLTVVSMRSRVAQLLASYAESMGLPVERGTRIRVPLSQGDIANDLGVSLRSVTRAIKDWMDEGVIGKDGRHVIVHDLLRLKQEADAQGTCTWVHTSDQFLKIGLPLLQRGQGEAGEPGGESGGK